jgi:hypothetical protein
MYTNIIISRVCANDKLVGYVVVVSTISQDLGTGAICKHNESVITVKFGETMASVCFKLRETIHKYYK